MIPKWRLALYSFVAVIVIVFLFLLAIFSLSFIFFVLSRYGFMYLPMFGFMTTLHMLQAIPLLLLLCTVALLLMIEIISRKSSLSFRRPLAITLLFITSCAVVLSFIVSMTPMHEYLHDYAKEHNIPIMFKAYKRPLPIRDAKEITILRGNVVTLSTSSLRVRLFDGTEVDAYTQSTGTVLVPSQVGSDVLLFGTFVDGAFVIMDTKHSPIMPFEGKRKRMHMEEEQGRIPQRENEINVNP